MTTPPTTDAYSMVTIERAQLPQQYEFGIQTTFGWGHSPFSPKLSDPNNPSDVAPRVLIENQYTLDLGVFFGLSSFLSLAAIAPLAANSYNNDLVGQPIVVTAPTTMNPTGFPQTSGLYRGQQRQTVEISRAGLRDPRFAAKVRFYGSQHFEIGTLLEMTLPLGDRSAFMGEYNVTFRPKLLLGVMTSRLNFAVNLGAIVRPESTLYDPYTDALTLKSSHELSWGAGATLFLHRMISLGAEGIGTVPIAGGGDPTALTASVLGTVYLRALEKWRLYIAGGGGLIGSSARNADGRLLVGFSHSLSPREGGLR